MPPGLLHVSLFMLNLDSQNFPLLNKIATLKVQLKELINSLSWSHAYAAKQATKMRWKENKEEPLRTRHQANRYFKKDCFINLFICDEFWRALVNRLDAKQKRSFSPFLLCAFIFIFAIARLSMVFRGARSFSLSCCSSLVVSSRI